MSLGVGRCSFSPNSTDEVAKRYEAINAFFSKGKTSKHIHETNKVFNVNYTWTHFDYTDSICSTCSTDSVPKDHPVPQTEIGSYLPKV